MAAIPRFYRKYIATGNGFLIFSIFYAVVIRTYYFLTFIPHPANNGEGYLSLQIDRLLSNGHISLLSSTLVVGLLAFLAALINNKYLLIRQKTLLPSAFIILLFSSHPDFINMSGEYISAVLGLIMTSMLFLAYNSEKKQHVAFQISFMLALSSLFSFSSIVYLPILWAGLAMMRSFNFKVFIASLLGIFIVYFPIFSWYLLTNQVQELLLPITDTISGRIKEIPVISYTHKEWIIIGCSLLLLLVTISDNYINRHKDKIKVRNYFNLLFILTLYAFIAFLLLNINTYLHLFSIFITGTFILSHFFALVEKKAGVILFYLVLLIYFAISLTPFLPF